MKLYVLPVGEIRESPPLPVQAYLLVLDGGRTVLVDSGPALSMVDDPAAPFALAPDDHVVARLALIGYRPADIDQVICTHLDPDHCGSHDQFPDAEFVVQRRELHAARTSGHMRYEWMRSHWEFPGQRWRQVDGDVVLHPGVELIETGGHTVGHQSVLIHLPETGRVVIAGDAIPHRDQLEPDTRTVGHHDHDEAATRQSTRKLVDLARTAPTLLLHSHDPDQATVLVHAPDSYR